MMNQEKEINLNDAVEKENTTTTNAKNTPPTSPEVPPVNGEEAPKSIPDDMKSLWLETFNQMQEKKVEVDRQKELDYQRLKDKEKAEGMGYYGKDFEEVESMVNEIKSSENPAMKYLEFETLKKDKEKERAVELNTLKHRALQDEFGKRYADVELTVNRKLQQVIGTDVDLLAKMKSTMPTNDYLSFLSKQHDNMLNNLNPELQTLKEEKEQQAYKEMLLEKAARAMRNAKGK